MSSKYPKPDTSVALSGLRDFQLKTVDYVFERLYHDGMKRFLVADEVGLGKTFVARGLVARAIDHLWPRLDRIRRIDIIYICSNQDIARQNINRLNVFTNQDSENHSFATRLTYLPMQVRDLDAHPLNFISFSPGTSFNQGHSTGTWNERVLLYCLLKQEWEFGESMAPKNLFQCLAGRDSWLRNLAGFQSMLTDDPRDKELTYIDPTIRDRFIETVRADKRIMALRDDGLSMFGRFRERIPQDAASVRAELIGRLRRQLAKACIDRLEPDIIILDEFQRFRDLLNSEATNEAQELAQQLFQWSYEHDEDDDDPRVLLLSATPYKPFTLNAETESEDHYQDFVHTTEFLLKSKTEALAFKADLNRFRNALFSVGAPSIEHIQQTRDSIERRLRRVMARTERLSVHADRNGMLDTSTERFGKIQPIDLKQFAMVDAVAKALKKSDPIEYWKSAPYLLNVMDRHGYRIKEDFVAKVEDEAEVSEDILQPLRSGKDSLLSWKDIEAYNPVNSGNARMRALLEQTVEQDTWQLLWIPASAPYYRPESGPYTKPELAGFSKFLVFSAWRVVPKVIAMLTSYEAERRMCKAALGRAEQERGQYTRWYSSQPTMMDFPVVDGEPQGMTSLMMLYPSLSLALACDPLLLSAQLAKDGQEPTIRSVRGACRAQIEQLLLPVLEKHQGGSGPGRRWYWAALALLDRVHHSDAMQGWLRGSLLPDTGSNARWRDLDTGGGAATNYQAHVDRWQRFLETPESLGAPPADLVDVLTDVALGGPAVAALRCLLRVTEAPDTDEARAQAQASAANVALGFRTLFNNAAVVAMLRRGSAGKDRFYWRRCLQYGVEGNLQSVIDEYAHMLRESLGLIDKTFTQAINQMSAEMRSAVAVRTVSLSVDDIRVSRRYGTVSLNEKRLRCRYALRYGDGKAIDRAGNERGDMRRKQVQQAFNSPFWPFVLATTSIGQEGLDFHPYCHNVFHWNLPANPVDLEQREGRVHRYKGHAIRKNLGDYYPLPDVADRIVGHDASAEPETLSLAPDLWAARFDWACANPAIKQGYDDLVPYWIFPGGKHRIRRHAPVFPLSRDEALLAALQKGVGAYRLAFGQPRQEDLLAFLKGRFGESLDADELSALVLDLSPR